MATLADLYPAYGIRPVSIGGNFNTLLGLASLARMGQGVEGVAPPQTSTGVAAATPAASVPTGAGSTSDYLSAIRRFEGFSERPYWDVRQWTSGYGTRASGPNEMIDRAEAERRLQSEWGNAVGQVRGFGAQLTPGREAALASLTFNAGPSWMRSGLGNAVRAGDWDTARNLFLQYNQSDGAFNRGLANRRAQEVLWFGY